MVGKVTTSGDIAIRANVARQLFGVDGSGIKIGIVSTSFNALSGLDADIRSGDFSRDRIKFDFGSRISIAATF